MVNKIREAYDVFLQKPKGQKPNVMYGSVRWKDDSMVYEDIIIGIGELNEAHDNEILYYVQDFDELLELCADSLQDPGDIIEHKVSAAEFVIIAFDGFGII